MMDSYKVKEEYEDFVSNPFYTGDFEVENCLNEGQKVKCGEILLDSKQFCFSCLFCGYSLSSINLFFRHILHKHLKFLSDTDPNSMEKLVNRIVSGYSLNEEKERSPNKKKYLSDSNENQEHADSLLLEIEKLDNPLDVKCEVDELGNISGHCLQELQVAETEEETFEYHVEDTSDEGNTNESLGMSVLDENEEPLLDDKISEIQIELVEDPFIIEEENHWLVERNSNSKSTVRTDNEDDITKELESNDDRSYTSSNKTHACPDCNKSYSTRAGLRKHLKLHEPLSSDCICPECGKEFPTNTHLNMHRKRHRQLKNHPCEICGAHFADPSNLRVHVMRHKGIRPHACLICEKSFHSSTELKLHVRAHTGEKPYVCELCGKKFTNSGHLASHKLRHSNDRRHKCEICNKRFYDLKLLRDHSISHSSERPFECSTCRATFQRKKALLQHQQLHLEIKKYKCKLCDKTFAQNAGLYSHMKSHSAAGCHTAEL